MYVTESAVDWSPADNPYAIAVSEAQWWLKAVQLEIRRLQGPNDDHTFPFSSRQIDARLLIFVLQQLLSAEKLEQDALEALGIDAVVRDSLKKERQQFEDSLPGITIMRNALMHFDGWAQGKGHGPQKERIKAGASPRDAAGEFWGFAYDPSVGTISLGPYTIDLDVIEKAAARLSWAIYVAAGAVDQRNALNLRDRVVDVLKESAIAYNSAETPLKLSMSGDRKVWFFLAPPVGADTRAHYGLAKEIIDALGRANLRLVSMSRPDQRDVVENLVQGESLACEAALRKAGD